MFIKKDSEYADHTFYTNSISGKQGSTGLTSTDRHWPSDDDSPQQQLSQTELQQPVIQKYLTTTCSRSAGGLKTQCLAQQQQKIQATHQN